MMSVGLIGPVGYMRAVVGIELLLVVELSEQELQGGHKTFPWLQIQEN
jgi:hypothetical protein